MTKKNLHMNSSAEKFPVQYTRAEWELGYKTRTHMMVMRLAWIAAFWASSSLEMR